MAYGSGYPGGYSGIIPTLPTLAIEWEFTAGVWTDITAYVSSVATRRGKNVELGAYETGTMQLVLRNEDRRFDPAHSAGPYYGNLRPNRRIRFRVDYLGTTYPVFVGYVDRITQRGDGPNWLEADVDLSDRFKILNRAELPVSVYAAEIQAADPVAWWRLDEPGDTTTVADSAGSAHGTPTGAPAFGEASLIVRDPGGAMATLAQTDGVIVTPWTAMTARPITLEAWITTGLGGGGNVVWLDGDTTGIALAVQAGTERVQFAITSSTGSSVVTGTTNTGDGTTHHIMGVWEADGDLKVYVDGVAEGGAANNVGTLGAVQRVLIGGTNDPVRGVLSGLVGTIDEAAVYNVELTATPAEDHNDAGRIPWRGDSPGLRMSRILALAEVPLADYTLDVGETTLQSTDLGGSALGYAQKIEQTELGAFFVAKNGEILFIGRHDLEEDYVDPVAVLVDDPPAAGEVRYRSVTFETDEADLITRATVSREGSVAVTYADQAAVDEFGPIDFTADGLLHDDDDYSARYAEWIVNTHSSPAERVGTVTLTPGADPAVMYPELLGLELADRVTLTRRYAAGAAKTGDYRVTSISHAVAGVWATTLELAPAGHGSDNLPVFVWGETRWGEHVWGL